MARLERFHAALLAIVFGVFIWSGIAPKDRLTWVMEVAPAVIGFVAIAVTWRRFPLTNLLCGLIAFHMVVLMVGGKYTYAEMPLFNWLRDTFDLSRNHYDRLGHLMQGFVPAMVVRELLLRTSPLRRGKWMFALILLSCLGMSALYELIEWAAAVILGSGADAFLGMQGDPWDTQKDMLFCGIGAALALVFLPRVHDRQLEKMLGKG